MEKNPNHPTTRAASDHWHKIAAVLMHKFHGSHVVITLDDLEALPRDMFVTVQELHDGLHLRFVDRATADALARKHGGLPT